MSSNRVAPGGFSTICLGVINDDASATNQGSSNKYASGANQNSGNFLTDRSSTRLHSAPGGQSSICLGVEEDVSQVGCLTTKVRGSPGGPTSISLTYDETPSKSMLYDFPAEPDAAGVALGPSNGEATICLGTLEDTPLEPVESARQAPGGACTIRLGYEPELNQTPCKLQPPGGHSTICLGVDDDRVLVDVPPSGRKAPGGNATVCLGVESRKLDEVGEDRENELVPSARKTPGGNSSICFGASDEPAAPPSGRCAPGGRSSISFGATNEMFQGIGIPPGGKTSICLGVADDDVLVANRDSSNKYASGANQNAGNCLTDRSSTRLHQAPGGNSTICLGVEDDVPSDCVASDRIAPGGTTTICLGVVELSPRGLSHRQAPGGNTTICLGEDCTDENVNTLNFLSSSVGVVKKGGKVFGEQTVGNACNALEAWPK